MVNPDIQVIRNDEKTIAQIEAMRPEAIFLSPGPGKPSDAGVCVEAVRYFADKIPIFGVCLGHQAICEAFGATVSYASRLMHGKTSEAVLNTESRLFRGMGESLQVARYHSLAAVRGSLPDTLSVVAETAAGEIMAVEHTKYAVYGVQFHPESVMTPDGLSIIRNFLEENDHD